MKPITILSLAACAGLLCACDSKPTPPAPQAPTTTTPAPAPAPTAPPADASSVAMSAQTLDVLGVSFPIPEGWASVPPSNSMRLAEVRVPGSSGDAPTECVIAFSSAGGSVEGNIARWAGQVASADGKPLVANPTRLTADGLPVSIVEFEGTYAGMGDGAPLPNWMLRGAIVETPGGLLFVKMTGPAEAMRAAGPAFNQMLAQLSAKRL